MYNVRVIKNFDFIDDDIIIYNRGTKEPYCKFKNSFTYDNNIDISSTDIFNTKNGKL